MLFSNILLNIIAKEALPLTLSLMRCSVSTSNLSQDNRVESPIPILPLSTPDVETEKLIKMKDEEVSQLNLVISVLSCYFRNVALSTKLVFLTHLQSGLKTFCCT